MIVKYYTKTSNKTARELAWGKTTLESYIRSYTPSGWEELFEAAEDIVPEISAEIEHHVCQHTVYPPLPLVFNALDSLQPKEIKVVIIGQDPYIKEGEAMGWSFSVPDGIRLPPSLRNIYKELDNEGYTGYKDRKTGELSPWVERGVFLYNISLTVNQGMSDSHKTLWSDFSEMLINYLNGYTHIAWILLGAKAQRYAKYLDTDQHGVFRAGHPSPLNRKGDFHNSDVFIKAEKYLQEHNRDFTWNCGVPVGTGRPHHPSEGTEGSRDTPPQATEQTK